MPLWMTSEIRESLSPVERALAIRLGREIERSLDPRELRRRGPRGLEEIVVQALALLRGRRPEEIHVRVEQPGGLRAGRTTIEVGCTDGPFLVDTLRLSLRRLGLRERVLLHPVLSIERGPDGALERVHKEPGEAPTESYLYAEVPFIREPERRRALETELREIYREVHQVVRHHGRMVKALRRHIADLECATPALADGPEGVQALMRFLDWLADDNYIFLGYRYYSVSRSESEWSVTVAPESGLGILHDASGSRFADGRTGAEVPEVLRKRLDDERLVFFDKSRHTSRIHRPGNLDCISVKGIDNDGRVVGFGQFVGLLTYRALRTRPSEIPILRETRTLVLERAGGRPRSHTSKIAAEAYDSLPVEMLFQFSQADVVSAVERIVAVTDHGRLGFFLLPDPTSRSFFVSVIVPRFF
jgi:glutamate dehydrogenase